MMTKEKTDPLDALRALIAERQQYDQWIATLESKRDGTVKHVFDRVYSDYRSRLDRVVGEIRSHAAELQLSITTVSARLGEVERDEESRRELLQEAELRATVGEYAADQWENVRAEGESELERIRADRAPLESQLAELRSIQKLSEVDYSGMPEVAAVAPPEVTVVAPPLGDKSQAPREIFPEVVQPREAEAQSGPTPAAEPVFSASPTPGETQIALQTAPFSAPAPASASVSAPEPEQLAARGNERELGVRSTPKRSTPTRPEQSKTLKCPECGTANYPTEWYCEKCGGELATM
jgi:hypothetical protein